MSVERPTGQWPAWMDDLLAYGPLAELEPEWRAEIGDAITLVLDERALAVARARRQQEES